MDNEVKELIDAIKPLIQKNGIRIDGIGILPGKLDKMIELQDRTNFLLAKLLEAVR